MCDDVAESGYSAESIRKACSKLTAHIYRSDFIASDMMQKNKQHNVRLCNIKNITTSHHKERST